MRPSLLQTLTWATVLGAVLSAVWLAWSDGSESLPWVDGALRAWTQATEASAPGTCPPGAPTARRALFA